MTQHLTLAGVKAKAIEYYNAGKLTAQDPGIGCLYSSREMTCRCAIGASLSEETLKEVFEAHVNYKKINSLREKKIISYSDSEHLELTFIQMAHDRWCRKAMDHLDDEAEAARKIFVALLED